MCPRCEKGNTASSRWPIIRALKRDASRKNVVTWHFDKNRKWTARMQDGKWFRSLKNSHLCACVKSFGNIYMYGSSHIRYKYDYMIDKCYKRPADLVRKHYTISVANLHYSWTIFSDEFGRILSDKGHSLKEKDLVFVQTGAHDLSTRGLAIAMSTGIRRFAESLAELEEVSQRKGFKVVVLTSPPNPDIDNRLKTRGGLNNFATTAFNEMIREKAADTMWKFSMSSRLFYQDRTVTRVALTISATMNTPDGLPALWDLQRCR